eukprot:5755866-Prymnesium_polylepis.1
MPSAAHLRASAHFRRRKFPWDLPHIMTGTGSMPRSQAMHVPFLGSLKHHSATEYAPRSIEPFLHPLPPSATIRCRLTRMLDAQAAMGAAVGRPRA